MRDYFWVFELQRIDFFLKLVAAGSVVMKRRGWQALPVGF